MRARKMTQDVNQTIWVGLQTMVTSLGFSSELVVRGGLDNHEWL